MEQHISLREVLIVALEARPRKARDNDKYYGSELGSCPMSIALRQRGKEAVVTPSSALNMYLGENEHKGIQDLCAGSITAIEKEVSCPCHNIKGHLDLKLNGKIHDIKTISPYAMKDYSKTLPYAHHVTQLHAYMHCENDKTVAYIDYVNKGNGDMYEVCVPWDDAIWATIEQRIAKVKELQKRKTVKLADVKDYLSLGKDKIPWECRYCFYKNDCPVYADNFK